MTLVGDLLLREHERVVPRAHVRIARRVGPVEERERNGEREDRTRSVINRMDDNDDKNERCVVTFETNSDEGIEALGYGCERVVTAIR